jgi:hypothetical protein
MRGGLLQRIRAVSRLFDGASRLKMASFRGSPIKNPPSGPVDPRRLRRRLSTFEHWLPHWGLVAIVKGPLQALQIGKSSIASFPSSTIPTEGQFI